MNYSKFTDVVLIKKINANEKIITEILSELEPEKGKQFVECTLTDRDELEKRCTESGNLAKELRAKKKVIDEAIKAEKLRIEEEDRLAEKQKKDAKIAEIKANSICDTSKLTRLKFRFFNLAVPSEDDPDGLVPNSSGPFFNTVEEQFYNELVNSSFKLYIAEFKTEEDMKQKQEFMQKNLNKTLSNIVNVDYEMYFFTCFRCVIFNDGELKYQSYWISNYNKDINTLIEGYEFMNLGTANSKNISFFLPLFNKGGFLKYEEIPVTKTSFMDEIIGTVFESVPKKDESISENKEPRKVQTPDFTIIDEIYAR